MELKDLLVDMLVEEVRNKKLLNTLYNKWKSEDDTLTPEVAEFIFTRYMGGTDDDGNRIDPLKDRLSTKRKEVSNFLIRFNGEFGRTKFEPSRLKDIASYSLNQIKFLLKQFGVKIPEGSVTQKPYFFEDPSVPRDKWIEESKNLWFGDRFKIYDDGQGFRIYKPETQKDSISFGIYQGHIAKSQHSRSNKWCVTNYKGDGDSMSNLWQSYRENHERTFYFVIDETKGVTDEYYIGALQRLKNGNDGGQFRLTNAPNNNQDMLIKINDPLNPEKSLFHIYPKIKDVDVINELGSVEFDASKEMNLDTDKLTKLLGQIKEEPGQYDFVVQDPDVKRAYISRGFELEKIRSFDSLDDTDIRLYFEVRGQGGNANDTIKSYELLKYLVRQRGSDLSNYIGSFYKRIGSSIANVFQSLLEKTFTTIFWSKQQEDIKVVKDDKSGKFGIFDFSTAEWVKLNGITYEPEYSEIWTDYCVFDFDGLSKEVTTQSDDDQENQTDIQEQMDGQITYVVQVYSKTNNMDDNENFYIVDDVTTYSAEVTMISHQTWVNSVKPALVIVGDDNFDYEKPYNPIEPKTQSAINEKGV